MGLILGTYGDNGPGGWTVFDLTGYEIWYVSSSLGSDSNDGTAPTTGGGHGPWATCGKAFTFLNARYGSGNVRAACLLRMGDAWTDDSFGNVTFSGESAAFPVIFACYNEDFPVGTYGVFPRQSSRAIPFLDGVGTNPIIGGFNLGFNYSAIVGWKMRNKYRDPANPSYNPAWDDAVQNGIVYGNHYDFALVEGCDVSFFANGIMSNPNFSSNTSTGLILRRNKVHKNWNTVSAGASGGVSVFYTFTAQIEENVLHRNGYNPDATHVQHQDVHNHNIYIQGDAAPVIYRGNISSNNSSGDNLRSFAQIYENIWIGGSSGHIVANSTHPGQTARAYHNVYTEIGKDSIGSYVAISCGLGMASNYDGVYYNLGFFEVYENVGCNFLDQSQGFIESVCSCNNVDSHGNIGWHLINVSGANIWFGGGGSVLPITDGDGGVQTLTITNAGTVPGANGTYTDVFLTGGTHPTQCRADITVSGGFVTNIVVSAPLFTPGGGTSDASLGGYGYQVGDLLGAASGDIGGVVGFQCRVDAIFGNITSTNDTFVDTYPTNSGGWAYPATATAPDFTVLKGFGTTSTDLVEYIIANQSKQNWNPDLTSRDGVTKYILGGFNITISPPQVIYDLMGQSLAA